MPKSAVAVREIPSKAMEFQRYVESGSWQCPGGGAHFWVHLEGDMWKCRKCPTEREFECPDYAWNDKMDPGLVWGVSGIFDSLQRSLNPGGL